MDHFSNWFYSGALPANAITTHYDWYLYTLSCVIAVFASYVSLSLLNRMQSESDDRRRFYWLCGGAFTLGAGVWSMHFIGMLALVMPIQIEYDALWTALSLCFAILLSGAAFFLLQRKCSNIQLALSGILIGLGFVVMHYMGVEGMRINLSIKYHTGLFVLSILIAIATVECAFFLAKYNNRRWGSRQFAIQVVSALVMGLAMCFMHYVGMSAAVFTPHAVMIDYPDFKTISPGHLAIFVATISALLISLALTVSGYYRRMVAAVENEKEFLNAMLDNIEDGIIACDASGNITVLNSVLQAYIRANIDARHLDDLPTLFSLRTLDNQPLDKGRYPLRLALWGERVHGMELNMSFNNKITRRVIIDGQSIVNSLGVKLGAVIVIHDVTELKRTETLKNEFVSTVSHELRTPLTSIRGSLGLLLSGIMGVIPDKAGKLLEIANNNCERLLYLINDILDIEKIEAGKMHYDIKPVLLNDLISRSIEDNKMYADKYSVSIDFQNPLTQVQVMADPDRLTQVLANLLSNACKFSPPQGRVEVRVDTNSDRNKVRVVVEDHGSGIPYEFQSRLFQKFNQADSSNTRGKGGTGLGLHISKRIIETFGGTIGCISKPGEGATFYFELALVESTGESGVAPCDGIDTLSVKRLLICEDDEDQSDYLNVLLESAGFVVDVANTVAEAKKYLAEYDYQVLLLDLILPDQDGIAFIRELRADKKTEHLHIIVLSVIAQTGRSLLHGDALAVLDWLDKPVDFQKLLASINRAEKRNDTSASHSAVAVI